MYVRYLLVTGKHVTAMKVGNPQAQKTRFKFGSITLITNIFSDLQFQL